MARKRTKKGAVTLKIPDEPIPLGTVSKPQPPNSSILLIADGLRPSMLGPYGNTWFDTVYVNQLASESLLFEQAITDTPDGPDALAGILHGQHCLDQPGLTRNPHLANCAGMTGVESVLVTAAPEKNFGASDVFDRVIEVELPKDRGLATEIAGTQLATFFAAAVDLVQQTSQPTFLVLDCPGFFTAWDAPYSYRLELAEEDDPDPTKIVDRPNQQFNAATDDPDQLLDCQMAYGGQVMLFDQLLGILLGEIDRSGWARQALFSLTATRGYPLGEHGVVGFYRQILHAESVHVPLMIRWPAGLEICGRSQRLVQPGSLYSLFRAWHSNSDDSSDAESIPTMFPEICQSDWMPDQAGTAVISKCNCIESEKFAIQTHSWKYMAGSARQLFVKPDDQWEFNDVAELCPQIAGSLQVQLEHGIDSLSRGQMPLFQLADELAFGIE